MATEDFVNVRLSTATGIEYKLVEGYPRGDESTESCDWEEEYIIQAKDIDAFLDESISRRNVGGGVGDVLPFIGLPRTMPGRPDLSTVKVHVEPLILTKPIDPYGQDPLAGAVTETYGKLARVHIWYSSISRDFFRDIVLSAGAEYLQIPPSNLNVSTDANGGPLDPGNNSGQSQAVLDTAANHDNLLAAYKLIPTIEWTYKLQQFASPNWATCFALLGHVNDRRSLVLCEGAIEETVMYVGVSATRTYANYRILNPDGSRPNSWFLDLRFSQRTIQEGGMTYGWNHVYSSKTNAGKGGWTRLERAPKGSGKFLYEKADLGTALLTAVVI